MSDDTLLSRIRELEAENAELRKTSKADIDARAERLGMRCSNCKFVMVKSATYCHSDGGAIPCYRGALPANSPRMTIEASVHYCKEWEPK